MAVRNSSKLPQKIKDEEYLERVNGLILSRISAFYSKLFQIVAALKDKDLGVEWDKKSKGNTPNWIYEKLSQMFIPDNFYDSITDLEQSFGYYGLEEKYSKLFLGNLL